MKSDFLFFQPPPKNNIICKLCQQKKKKLKIKNLSCHIPAFFNNAGIKII